MIVVMQLITDSQCRHRVPYEWFSKSFRKLSLFTFYFTVLYSWVKLLLHKPAKTSFQSTLAPGAEVQFYLDMAWPRPLDKTAYHFTRWQRLSSWRQNWQLPPPLLRGGGATHRWRLSFQCMCQRDSGDHHPWKRRLLTYLHTHTSKLIIPRLTLKTTLKSVGVSSYWLP